MATTAELAQLVHDSLVSVAADNKGIGKSIVKALPFYNVTIGNTEYEGTDGDFGHGLISKVTEVMVRVTIEAEHEFPNPYSVVDTETEKIIADMNRIRGSDSQGRFASTTEVSQTAKDIGVVDMWVAGIQDYGISDIETDEKSIGCAVLLMFRHRGES